MELSRLISQECHRDVSVEVFTYLVDEMIERFVEVTGSIKASLFKGCNADVNVNI